MIDHQIDVLYLVHNRKEFTRKTLELLIRNTNWSLVDQVWLYDDDSKDGAGDLLEGAKLDIAQHFDGRGDGFEDYITIERGFFGGPVSVMNHYLDRRRSPWFAKVDSDTAVPPAWLDVLANTATEFQEYGLIGMEVMTGEALPACSPDQAYGRGVEPSTHIGGIGLMRRGIFDSPDRPSPAGVSGRFGFTEWQHRREPKRGWLHPPIPVALLDRVPIEPWRSLSEEYVRNGWQREWPHYGEQDRHIWGWLESERI